MIKGMLTYVLLIAVMMVSTVPTYSGKLIGERMAREWVLPAIFTAIGFVAMLVTYPYETLVGATLAYLASIVWSYTRFQGKLDKDELATELAKDVPPAGVGGPAPPTPPGESLH
jgi:CDP-diacylglycerol---serine O-phosphatidyltransferase